MCCLLCLHRHQIHLISYGFVSFGLIATGLVFTIFAIFQKDSQIGKVWLAGPTTMVVGLVLCGKVIIDWGPGMAHGLNAEDSVDALDQLTLVNPALNGNGALIMNGGYGGANGAFQQLKAPIQSLDNLTPPNNLSPLLTPNANVFNHFKKKTSNANSSNNGSMRNYGSVFALPTTALISRGNSAASLTLNESGKKLLEEPPDLFLTSALAGRNGAIDCIQYASDVNSNATTAAAPSPKFSPQDPLLAQLNHSVPQQRLTLTISQQNNNKNNGALFDSLQHTTNNNNNNNNINVCGVVGSNNKLVSAGQPIVMQISCRHTVSAATQTEGVTNNELSAVLSSGRHTSQLFRCSCNSDSLTVVPSKSTSTINSTPTVVRHRMNSWSIGGGGNGAFCNSFMSSTFRPPHSINSTTDNNNTGYCRGFAGGCCCYYCSYAAVMLAAAAASASNADSKAYCPIARHSYDVTYGPPRVTVLHGGNDTDCTYGSGNAPTNYYGAPVLTCAMHDHHHHHHSSGLVRAAADDECLETTVDWRRESTSTTDTGGGGGGGGEDATVAEQRTPLNDGAVTTAAVSGKSPYYYGDGSSTLCQGETFVLNERKFFI